MGESPGASPLRAIFDAVERPLSRRSEQLVQSDVFMDGLALAWRSGRRVEGELRRGLELWLGAMRLATRSDVDRLAIELARIQRELRALRRDLPERR